MRVGQGPSPVEGAKEIGSVALGSQEGKVELEDGSNPGHEHQSATGLGLAANNMRQQKEEDCKRSQG